MKALSCSVMMKSRLREKRLPCDGPDYRALPLSATIQHFMRKVLDMGGLAARKQCQAIVFRYLSWRRHAQAASHARIDANPPEDQAAESLSFSEN
jgi:hypothetical protein